MPFEFSEVGARDLAKEDGILDGIEIFLPGIEDDHLRDNPCYTFYRLLSNGILSQLLIHRVM
jgi:hypothetical protein